MFKMTEEYIIQTLKEERLWKVKERDFFAFGEWEIALTKEENGYSIFASNETGIKTFIKVYESMEDAFLHVVNNFNENPSIENRYNTVDEYIFA